MIKHHVPVVDDSDFHNESKEQVKILSVDSNPLGERTENLDALQNNFLQDTVGVLRDNFGNSRLYQCQEIDNDGTIANNHISESYCSDGRNFMYLKKKGEINHCFEDKECSIIEMPLHAKQNTKLACISSESRNEHMQNFAKANPINDSNNVVSASSNEVALSRIDGNEKKMKNELSDLSACKGIIDSSCSSVRFVSDNELYPSKDAQEFGNASREYLPTLNTFDAESPKSEDFPRLEERSSLSCDVYERSRPTTDDGTYASKKKLDITIDMKKQNDAVPKPLFRQWKNTDDLLENDDRKLTVRCEYERSRLSSRNKLSDSSCTNTEPMEKNKDRPKDDIKVVAATVVKVLSKYHQNNRIANKVS